MDEQFQLQLTDNQFYPYKLIKSYRAKYIRIKVSNSGEIKVVLPRGISEKHAHSFVQKKSQWITKTLANIPEINGKEFPEYLNLKLLNEEWNIKYINLDTNNKIQLHEIADNHLQISGNIEDWRATKTILNQWCKRKAEPIFKDMIEKLAEEHGFHFNKLTIRSQKTRWGSCSTRKNISLNSKLLFMPVNVTKYVIIHELCHTVEMNHSSRFWQLVEDCDENYISNRNELRKLGKLISL